MNYHSLSPYIRVAMYSTLYAPFRINRRVIFDYELILVADGQCNITIENKEYLCRKNDVILLRPGIPHSFSCIDRSDFNQPHIHFDLSYSAQSEQRYISFQPRENMSETDLQLIQADLLEKSIPSVFTPFEPKRFHSLFYETIDMFQKKENQYEILCKAKMLELLSCLLTQFETVKSARSAPLPDPLISVKNYIDSNYLSVITLDALAAQFYMNKYTMLRRFKTLYRKNIIAYYHEKRLDYMKHALSHTALSITALTEKMHFSDIYSMSRFFKSCTGLSPSAYRKKCVEKK